MITYLVGDPANGPFASFSATDEAAARAYVTKNWGPVLDIVDWTDEDGKPVDLFIVAA